MRFLDPGFLFGLLAIAVPVALHLLLRRRVPVLDFPLARLIAKAERSRQPRKRLNRVLLLVARALALALLSLALARAVLGPGRMVAAGGPVALVVVLDDSLSMRARDAAGRTAFSRGREAAATVLRTLPEGSVSAVLAASHPERAEATGLRGETAVSLAELERLEVGLRHVRLGESLAAAVRLLSLAPLPDRRVLLVSDLARHAFEDLSLPASEGPVPRLELVIPAAGEAVNRSVSGLDVDSLPDGRLGVVARASAWGGAAAESDLELRVGLAGTEARLAGRARVAPGAGAAVERRFDVQAGGDGYATVTVALEADGLPDDDVRHAAVHVARRLRLLVVDGDPQNLSFGSETFYLERALAPGVGLDFEAEFVTVPELRPDDFREHDVFLLANVPELTDERAAALTEAVRGGLGLIVTLGDRVDQRVYNGRLASILPATLGVQRAPVAPASLGPLPGGRDLPNVHVRRWFELVGDEGADTVGRLNTGEPVLLQSSFGAGRVLLFASTIDRSWTDLPISPHFLPALVELVERVAPRRSGLVLEAVPVGRSLALRERLGLGPDELAEVVLPDDTVVPLRADPFAETARPGVHRVRRAGETLAAFAVVPDPAESDLSRHSVAELASLCGDRLVVGETGSDESTPGGGRPLWKALLVGLVVVTATESWLAREGGIRGLLAALLMTALSTGAASAPPAAEDGPALVQAHGRGGAAARRARPRSPQVRLGLLRPRADVPPDDEALRAIGTLGSTVARRTSVEVAAQDVASLHPLSPELFSHPLVFLSGRADWEPWDEQHLDAMATYLALGGMVVVDDRSGEADSAFARRARSELARAAGGRSFEPLPADHSVFRAYYLLDRPWGRVDVGEQLHALLLDGRAAVLLSQNDLLGALARDEFGQWSRAVQPGGRRQRELALRLGVNLVLYALTLDYKEDLVHLPHILERRR